MRARVRHLLAPTLAAATLAGCASADKHQQTTTAAGTHTTSAMAGMGMAGAPTVNGIHPVPIRTLVSAYWQGMEIQAQMMTPTPFVVFNGRTTSVHRPAKDTSFHLMVMLTDRHTHFQIPYATVWATVKNSSGKTVYSDTQWPMISEYMGSHYGNNVTLPGPGTYTLELLISPPVQARHLEYQHMWLAPHEVTARFSWKPAA